MYMRKGFERFCLYFFQIKVRYSEKDASKTEVRMNRPHVKSVVLSALNPFTLYIINVSAFTFKGEGSRSTVQEQTDEGSKWNLF